MDGLADLNLVAGEEIVARAASTSNVYAEAGGSVTLTGGKNVDVGLAIGGATVKSAKGAVSIYEYYSGSVVVEGGTTVTVIKEGSALSTTTGQPSGSAYGGNITVGVDASFGANPATATGYPQVDANASKQPTGDVVVNNYTAYTTQAGQASRVYGSGTAAVYTNGAAAVSVATAGAVTVKDVQVVTAATTLDGLINQAITDQTKAIDWFVFQGDTYLVVNGTTLNGSTSGANFNDYVIQLVGDYTTSLTGVSALSSGVLTLG